MVNRMAEPPCGWYLLLDEPPSVERRPIIVARSLSCRAPGEYLARVEALLFADEHGQLYILIAPFPVAVLPHPVAVAAFRIDVSLPSARNSFAMRMVV